MSLPAEVSVLNLRIHATDFGWNLCVSSEKSRINARNSSHALLLDGNRTNYGLAIPLHYSLRVVTGAMHLPPHLSVQSQRLSLHLKATHTHSILLITV